MGDFEARVPHLVFATHGFEVFLPTLAVGWIGEHEGELLRREGIVGKGRVLAAADDMVGVIAFTLEEHVRLANGVGFGVDFLTVQVSAYLLPFPGGDVLKGFFRYSEHAARTARAAVDLVSPGFKGVRYRKKHKVSHQPYGVARGPVLTGLFIILLVELA